MTPIKTILVPTDFSPASKRAVRYACKLADTCGASLHVMHVLENPFTQAPFSEMYAPPPDDFLAERERRTRAELEAQLTPEEKAKYSAAFILREGAPAQAILEYLNEQRDIDLVVMATAGRGGVARLMMGSIADKIVRAAPCPVLTIHPPQNVETGSAYRAA